MWIRKKLASSAPLPFFGEMPRTERSRIRIGSDGPWWMAGLCLWAAGDLHLCCPKPGLVGAEPACSLPTTVLVMSFKRPTVESLICVVAGIKGAFKTFCVIWCVESGASLCTAFLPVCLPLLVQPHEGERCFFCVLFSSFLGMHQTLWCVCGKLQSIGPVPHYFLHEQTPLTSVEPWCLGRTMPKAQREIRFKGFWQL